jgi:hypothetical protein
MLRDGRKPPGCNTRIRTTKAKGFFNFLKVYEKPKFEK